MTDDLDDRDKEMLAVLQEGLPLTSRPFAVIADELDWSEEEVLESVMGNFWSIGAALVFR